MDTLLRLLPAVVLLLLVSLVGGPAAAKGATDVVVSGPGVAHRHLVHTERPGDVDVYSLADATGIYGIYGPGRFGDRPAVTDAQLGPRYVLTWWQGDQRTVQHVYPFAEGGPWSHVPSGQVLWETEVADGWLALPATARQLLVRLGAEPPPATAPAATSTRAVTSGPPVSDAGRWRPSTYVVAGGVLAVVVLVGAAVALRRSLWRG